MCKRYLGRTAIDWKFNFTLFLSFNALFSYYITTTITSVQLKCEVIILIHMLMRSNALRALLKNSLETILVLFFFCIVFSIGIIFRITLYCVCKKSCNTIFRDRFEYNPELLEKWILNILSTYLMQFADKLTYIVEKSQCSTKSS